MVALNIMPRIAHFLEGRSLLLLRTMELVKVLVSSGFDAVLQSIEAHQIMELVIDAFFSCRSSEFARHVVLGIVREVLRKDSGTFYRPKMLLLESSCLLTEVPKAYHVNAQRTRKQASLGHIAAVLTEVLAAAGKDSDVGCVVDAHGAWGHVRARYPHPNADENDVGLDTAEMVELFGHDPKEVIVSPPRAPVRCYVSPVPDRGSVTPDSSPEKVEKPIQEVELGGLVVGEEDKTLLRYSEEPMEEEGETNEDDEVMLVTGQLQNVIVGSYPTNTNVLENQPEEVPFLETSADVVHPRTPIHKQRPTHSLIELADIEESENKENCDTEGEPVANLGGGNTPKKIVHMGDGYHAVSGQSDTPKPKVQARSRTYYSRAAKTKSPFGSQEKTPKSRIASSPTAPGSSEKMPRKRLF
jgi:hypothetical protein